MKTLALDFGQKRIGVAIGESEDGIAFPRGPLTNSATIFEQIFTIVEAEGIRQVIVGLPLNLQGGEALIVAPAREFADRLEDFLLEHGASVPVDFFDERFTSKLAQQAGVLHGQTHKQMRGNLDSAAAALLLETYFAARS